VKDSRLYEHSFLSYVLARPEMRHTPVLGAWIPTKAYLLFKDATSSPSRNLNTYILLLDVYRFGQCWGERFTPISTFFSVVSSCAFRDAPYSRFRCGDPNQCLPNFLKMLLLALPQIYKRVFPLWKAIDLDSARVRDSCHIIFLFCRKFLGV